MISKSALTALRGARRLHGGAAFHSGSQSRSTDWAPSNPSTPCAPSSSRRSSTSNAIPKPCNPSRPSPISSSHSDLEMVSVGGPRLETISPRRFFCPRLFVSASGMPNGSYSLGEAAATRSMLRLACPACGRTSISDRPAARSLPPGYSSAGLRHELAQCRRRAPGIAAVDPGWWFPG
jgi:hypothetical protein